jgi:hypothetical protein
MIVILYFQRVILIALSYFLAKENNDILVEEGEYICMIFSSMPN